MGRDRILGGNGDDLISGDDQSDVIFGDHGRMEYIAGAADVTILHLVESISFPQGGIDTITSGQGDDIVVGGAQGDMIDAGDGQNVVFGDHGRVTGVEGAALFNRPVPSDFDSYTPDDYQVPNLALVEGFAPVDQNGDEHGGDDVITTGLGRDMVFGGAGGDTIVANFGESVSGGPLDGNNIVIGDYGFVDYMVNGDPHDIDLIASFDAWTNLGGADVIRTGGANDIVIAGTGGDVLDVGEGLNLAFGDNARLASDPTVADSTHETPFSVHEFRVCTVETIGFLDADGGGDTIYGSNSGDFLFGGGGNDVIFGNGGNDIIFGDQGRITCRNNTTLIPNDRLNGVCVALGGRVDFFATNIGVTTGSGDDLVFAGSGDDIVLGQQGNDILYGEGGDDILVGGSNVAGALDNVVTTGFDGDIIDGGSGDDLIAGDNADVCYRPVGDHLDPRMQVLAGTVIYGTTLGTDDGQALVTGVAQNDPTGIRQYVIHLLDHSDDIEAEHPDLWGDDYIAGGSGSDEIYGQLGGDVIQGDGYVDGLVLVTYDHDMTAADPFPVLLPDGVDGTRIGAWRSDDQTVDETLHVNPSVELVTDGDDYIEGNGGDDTIFGNLGQDDIIGDNSDLFLSGLLGQVVTLTTDVNSPIAQDDFWRIVGISADGRTLTLSGRVLDAATAPTTLSGLLGALAFGDVTWVVTAHGIALTTAGTWWDLAVCSGSTCRPAGADLIFGGAGIDIARNDEGDATIGADGSIITEATGHARDADVIAGDNAQIFRLVGTNGTQQSPNAYLTFAYDNYAGGLRLIPRAVELLDYTFGGPAFDAASAATDRGAGDEIHGEAGDDQIYGMRGNDVLFGDGQNDDLIGGYGDDWISGGTGDDAILGDDGRISTSRNSSTGWTAAGTPCSANGTSCYSEPLYGVLALYPTDPDTRTTQGDVLDELIYTPGRVQQETINRTGALNRSVNLTPFNVDPNDLDPLFRPEGGYDDIIFGGLGNDSIHGGSGDDALSGAEALVAGYAPNYITSCTTGGIGAVQDCTAVRDGLVRIDFEHPTNPGDILRYNPDDVDGWHYDRTRRAGEFDLYDEYEPRRAIFFNAAAAVWTCTAYSSSGKVCTANDDITSFSYHFFLNNTHDEGSVVNGCVSFAPNGTCLATGDANTDGDDVLFGDLGNDWIVGGTGRDTLWGGFGNDLLQADDQLEAGCLSSTPNGTCTETGSTWLNDGPDTHPTYEDRAYGGAGRDILIGNTGGDRLIDWTGEFNSYIVPFAPFGIATVSRQVPPALFEFLYALSKAQGADPTRAADTNLASAPRNGEPNGEIGLITQKDHGLWQDQSGAPADPQAGNIPGGKRDVLRSATFNDGKLAAVAVDSGVFDVTGGALNVSAASLGQDAAAVFYVDQQLPVYYEILASVMVNKPTAGWKANAFVMFDYFSPTDFKFAGLDQSTNKIVVGHRTAEGWIIDAQSAVGNIRSGVYYDIKVVVNGLVVDVFLNGAAQLTWQFAPRFIDGRAYGLNMGLAGLGSDNARGTFDNFVVRSLPPQTTFDETDDFAAGIGSMVVPAVGTWNVTDARLVVTPTSGAPAVGLLELPPRSPANTIDLEVVVRLAAAGSAGVVFDHYGDDDFKFVTLDAATGVVSVGHVIRQRRQVDATFAAVIGAGVDRRLVVTLFGTTVTVSVDGVVVGTYSYNGAVGDGRIGLTAERGSTTFDDLHVRFGVAPADSPDPLPPALTVPANVTRPADTGSATAVVPEWAIGTATATDNVPGVTLVRSGVPAGNVFTIGTTTITYTATDVFGNVTVKTQLITVIDQQAPTLTAPPAVTRTITGSAVSVIIDDATLGVAAATDNSGSVVVTRTGVPVGNVFTIGTTSITYTATDPSGNTTVRTQLVTVIGPTPTVTVAVLDATGAEAGRDPLVFVVSRSGSTATSLTVALVAHRHRRGVRLHGGGDWRQLVGIHADLRFGLVDGDDHDPPGRRHDGGADRDRAGVGGRRCRLCRRFALVRLGLDHRQRLGRPADPASAFDRWCERHRGHEGQERGLRHAHHHPLREFGWNIECQLDHCGWHGIGRVRLRRSVRHRHLRPGADLEDDRHRDHQGQSCRTDRDVHRRVEQPDRSDDRDGDRHRHDRRRRRSDLHQLGGHGHRGAAADRRRRRSAARGSRATVARRRCVRRRPCRADDRDRRPPWHQARRHPRLDDHDRRRRRRMGMECGAGSHECRPDRSAERVAPRGRPRPRLRPHRRRTHGR